MCLLVNLQPGDKPLKSAPGKRDAVLRAKAWAVHERLIAAYGVQPLVPRRDPMHELISTMLSHRTTQHNEDVAYHRMMDRYGSYEVVRDAPVDELAQTIDVANFAYPKAVNIKETLRRIIAERGTANIDFLADLPPAEGLAWLMDLPGVGIKTASLVLLFCFAKPLIPVDTHVHRVSGRLGLIGPKVTPAAAHLLLLELLPNDPPVLFSFHINMLRHGQQVCIWGTPRCERCVLTDLCDWYAEHRRPGAQTQ